MWAWRIRKLGVPFGGSCSIWGSILGSRIFLDIRGNPSVDFSWNLDTCSGKSSTGAHPALFKASRMPNVLYLEGQRGVISRSPTDNWCH